MKPSADAGIYIHIPFCRRKCGYCDFYSITDLTCVPDYIAALESEIASWAAAPLVFDTLYLGGGTPSLLPLKLLERIVMAVRRHLTLQPAAEVTLEANPDSIDTDKLNAWRHIGINRLSVGIQSFTDAHLSFLGRPHNARQAVDSLEMARKVGYNNLGMDLMYGLPRQTSRHWCQTLDQAFAFQPEHLSCYSLTLEPATPLGQAATCRQFLPASENRQTRFFSLTHKHLTRAGYEHYEISNFARGPATASPISTSVWRSRHNQKYWHHRPVLGLGAAAHSFMPPARFWNVPRVSNYIHSLQHKRRPRTGHEILTSRQQFLERLFLGLRTADGLAISELEVFMKREEHASWYHLLDSLRAKGFIQLTATYCRPTLKGLRYADSVAGMLFEE